MSIFNSWRIASARVFKRGAAHTTARARGAKGQRGRHPLFDPHSWTQELPPVKSHAQSYFIHMSTAITVSSLAAEWMCNFFHLLESWQFDNHRATAAVWAAKVPNLLYFFLPLTVKSHYFSNYFQLLSLSWHISCSLIDFISLRKYRASYLFKPWPFLELKKGENIITYVSFRNSRWSSQWNTHETMSKPTVLHQWTI